MRAKKRLGEMLVEAEVLSEEHLRQALAGHRQAGMKLGRYLVHQGFVSEGQVIDVVAQQLHIEKYRPDLFPVDASLGQIYEADLVKKYQAVPLQKQDSLVTVAMTDPMDINALDALEVVTNCEVEAVICTEQELNYLTGAIFGTYSGLDDILEDIGELDVESDAEVEEVQTGEDIQVSSLQDMAEEAPVIRLVNSILTQAVREKASDIHISPEKDYVQVRFRVDGRLHEVPAPPKSMVLPIVSRMKILANLDIAVSRIPQDGRFTINVGDREVNIRVSTLPTIYGENVVLRLLDMSAGIFKLKDLGMSGADRELINAAITKPYGMLLCTGPTGSGKSTSLYSMLSIINQPDINIITLEDPVEYRVAKIRQVQLNTKAGMTFASGLRSILRQDPDVVMVGEIRDHETANISVQAALTGHRLFSTVHTNDAAGAVTRFTEMGIEPFLLSSVLLVSIAQRLVRRVCPHCAEPDQPSERVLKYLGIGPSNLEGAELRKGRGCFQCNNTGYKGRTGLYEVLSVDEQVQDMIIAQKSSQEMTRVLNREGKLKTLREDALSKILTGVTSADEAFSAVMT